MSEAKTLPPPCAICLKPLGVEELTVGLPFHFACRVCFYCKSDMPNSAAVADCLKRNIPVSHQLCHEAALAEKIRSQVLPATSEYLRSVNEQILTIRSQPPAEDDLTKLGDVLRSAQELAANISWLLKLTQDKLRIRESQDYTEKIKTEKKAKAAEDATETERKNRLAAERANPALRERRKALEGLLAMGISKEIAETMLPAVPTETTEQK